VRRAGLATGPPNDEGPDSRRALFRWCDASARLQRDFAVPNAMREQLARDRVHERNRLRAERQLREGHALLLQADRLAERVAQLLAERRADGLDADRHPRRQARLVDRACHRRQREAAGVVAVPGARDAEVGQPTERAAVLAHLLVRRLSPAGTPRCSDQTRR
jgi:hypothetical protein